MSLRVGLVGAGGIADIFHLPGWKAVDSAEVVCICDSQEEVVKQMAEKHGIARHYTDLATMLKECPFDVLTVCTPHALHSDHAIQGLRAGRHVLVEKPLAVSTAQVDAIEKVAEDAGRYVMCAQHQRFRGITDRARAILKDSPLGDIYYARAQALEQRRVPAHSSSYTDKRLSCGGPLMDLGAHIIDITWWLMGCPTPVLAFGHTQCKLAGLSSTVNARGTWESYDVEDFACGQIRFDTGAVMTVEVSYLLNVRERSFHCELFGTRGGFCWPELLLTRSTGDGVETVSHDTTDQVRASIEQLRHFADCIRSNRSPRIIIRDSRTVIAMIEALYASGRSGHEEAVACQRAE